MSGRDLVGIAQTGSGKTLAVSISPLPGEASSEGNVMVISYRKHYSHAYGLQLDLV
jgi:superfamily II DNA/RNA helicase